MQRKRAASALAAPIIVTSPATDSLMAVWCLLQLFLFWTVSSTSTTTTTIASASSFPSSSSCHDKFDVLVYGSTPAGIMAAVAASRHLNVRDDDDDDDDDGDDTTGGSGSATSIGLFRRRVALLSQRQHIGGMCSGGLGESDIGDCAEQVMGGLAKEFFLRNAAKYINGQEQPRAPWNLEPHVAQQVFLEMLVDANVTILPFGQVESVYKNQDTGFIEHITLEEEVPEDDNVESSAATTRRTTTTTTKIRTRCPTRQYAAKVFIDASYEGDLMARTPYVDYTYGRESRHEYNESGAGSAGQSHHGSDFPVGVHINPFIDIDGDSDMNMDSSNNGTGTNSTTTRTLLPLLRTEQPLPTGHGDKQIQSYGFRLCVTDSNDLRVPFTQPNDYNANDWELLRRFWIAWKYSTLDTNPYKQQQALVPTAILGQIPSSSSPGVDGVYNNNKKYDANNCGYNLVHTDMIGGSWDYPEANYSQRQAIWDAHISYTKGFLWFMSSDASVPDHVRLQYATQWGYCGDEFHETNHFPPQLYVREARRLVGDRVFTQNDAMSKIPRFNDSVGMGCYGFDSHCEERYACTDPQQCTAFNKNNNKNKHSNTTATPYVNWQCGCSGIPNPGIYQMPIWVLFPKKDQVRNLLVPVCSSASHVAFATLRMEPQFMMLGHAAGVIAALVIQNQTATTKTTGQQSEVAPAAVQEVDRNAVAERLLRDGQILSLNENDSTTSMSC